MGVKSAVKVEWNFSYCVNLYVLVCIVLMHSKIDSCSITYCWYLFTVYLNYLWYVYLKHKSTVILDVPEYYKNIMIFA